MRQNDKKFIGSHIEELAAKTLQDCGLQLLTKNFYSFFGEIDLILYDQFNNQIVFVEVKYKSSLLFGEAVCAVNKSKQKKLIKTAYVYLNKNYPELPISFRFDIVSCSGAINNIKTDWIINAFS